MRRATKRNCQLRLLGDQRGIAQGKMVANP